MGISISGALCQTIPDGSHHKCFTDGRFNHNCAGKLYSPQNMTAFLDCLGHTLALEMQIQTQKVLGSSLALRWLQSPGPNWTPDTTRKLDCPWSSWWLVFALGKFWVVITFSVPEDFSGSWEIQPLLQNDCRGLLGLLGVESSSKGPEWNWTRRIWDACDAGLHSLDCPLWVDLCLSYWGPLFLGPSHHTVEGGIL